MAPAKSVGRGYVTTRAQLVARLQASVCHLVAGMVGAVAGWFVSHVWRQRKFWVELARIHGSVVSPGDLATWQRLANESTVGHMLSALLSTKEGWLPLSVFLVVISGLVYGMLLGAGGLMLSAIRGFQRSEGDGL